MRHFTSVKDLGDLNAALKEAFAVKADRFAYQHLGKNKTLIMIFSIRASARASVPRKLR